MNKFLFSLILALFCLITVLGQTSMEKVQKTAEFFVSAYNAKNYTQIQQQFNAQMKAAVPPEKLAKFLDDLHDHSGKITKLGSPDFTAPTTKFPADFERESWILAINLDAEGKIAGLLITPPPSDTPKNMSRNKTNLILPFKGEWFVVWGGDTPEQNRHHDTPNQRFAFDILKTDEKGSTHKGSGLKNEDYYAFGQEIIAPAAGFVTYVVDGVHDNQPGAMNRMFVPGNLVIIKHADGDYSLFAHFKQNSIRVKVVEKVVGGQTIGLCGNSGNSSEPHLHFQVQNTPFFEDKASIKTFFEKITVKRDNKIEIKNDYSPVKGDIVIQN